ncbi:hypothetical protein GALMADRAFT_123583 [Galerina marginata CBS 339.88]|uniref:LysM domain-containing protein n=1 Tax=Galerina marginata (strain CBS 339.88) TaxID=685588 RepID=A0A067T4S0_GALM3|nr:hypothetical protein GALMADRAFT_123583 [Galerina marginata CBS 339.88]
MSRLFALGALSLFLLSVMATSNLQHEIYKYRNAYKAQADAQRLENALVSPSASPTNVVNKFKAPSSLASATSFQIYSNATLPTNPTPSAACATALTASLSCNATIQYMSFPFDAGSLAAMCTPTCSSSLQTYRNSVASACNGFNFFGADNSTYKATLAIDTISEPYFSQCRTDSVTGKFCSIVLANYTTSNPSQGLLGYPQNELCTSCMLGLLNTTLSSAITFSNTLYSTLQSALGICGSSWSSYNVTTTASGPTFTSPAGTAPLGSNVTADAACALTGRNITVTSISTCAALSTQYSVTQQDILDNNPTILPANCTSGITPQTQLCIPESCVLFNVQSNQTCESIVNEVNSKGLAGSQNITFAQLQSFNPSISNACTNLASLGNNTVCITPHGGFSDLGNGGGSAVPSSSPTAVAPPPGQTAPGTTSACGSWYLIQPNNFCQQVALNNSITLDDFITLNPEIDANCTNLWANYYYCVAPYPPFNQVTSLPTITANSSAATMLTLPLTTATATTPLPFLPSFTGVPAPTNVANGTITNGCGYYYVVNTGDNCTAVEEFFDMTDSDFQAYNEDPALPCPSLTVGSAVCVQVLNATDIIPPTPTNAAAGSAPSGCAKWYTIVSGDGCPSVEQKFGLSAIQFFALNPEVKTDCTNLGLGEAYCLKAIGQSTGNSTAVPPNVVTGTDTQNCTRYDTVISGDSCPTIEARNNCTDMLFRALNPELNTGCTNIQLGGAYCVAAVPGYVIPLGPPSNVVSGTDTKDCAKYDTIISGDSCPSVEARNKISDSLFRILNPEINAACTNIQLGGAYCVQAVPGFTTSTTPASTSTTSSPSPTPTNIAAGSWTNCTSYYSVVSGDSCQIIDTKFSIAFSDFLRWNPEISTTCNNLQLASYCVAGSNKCPKIYTVASGDFCSKIETANNLSDAQFRSLNPWLDANCDFQVGQNMCVGLH